MGKEGVVLPVCLGPPGLNQMYHYPGLPEIFGQIFRAVEDGPYGRPCQGHTLSHGYVCYTSECLDEWAAGTDYFELNGKLVALQMFSDQAQDYTDIQQHVQQAKYPVFVYGGELSLEPVD